jgi:hypothetical protein
MPAKSKIPRVSPTALIAPCGMNCALCYAFLRDKNKCTGCRGQNTGKGVSILRCSIRTCIVRQQKFCDTKCERFPCERLRNLDKRYRAKYGMSMLENLANIETSGIRNFLCAEKTKWTCSGCRATLCVHKATCQTCGHKWH